MSYYFVSSVVFPWRYSTYSTLTSVNGSSSTGNCASENNPVICRHPTSSVLFDDPGGMPILTGLDNDMWASQLLTIQPTDRATFVDITFYFQETPGTSVERVEVVMFNCPQWEIGAQTIQVLDVQDASIVAPTSCDSLVRVCLSLSSTTTRYTLRFHSPVHWIHLAEVTFWNDTLTCPPDIVITEPTTPPPTSLITSASQESQPTTENTLPRSMETTVIAVVIVLLLLLMLVTVVVVVLVLWRCRHQHTAKEEASHTSSQTHTSQAPLVSQDTDQDNPSNASSNVYSSLTAQSDKKGPKSHTDIQEYSVLHHGEQPLEKKKSVNLTVRDRAGRQEEQSQEYSTLYHGEKPVQCNRRHFFL